MKELDIYLPPPQLTQLSFGSIAFYHLEHKALGEEFPEQCKVAPVSPSLQRAVSVPCSACTCSFCLSFTRGSPSMPSSAV